MEELCPELWLFESKNQEKPLTTPFMRCKQPVTDILIWTQCFASYTAILAGKYHGYTLYTIPHGQHVKDCWLLHVEGCGCVVYDTLHVYRRRAAIKKTLTWLEIESSLFNMLLTGRAKTSRKCTECFSHDHKIDQCPHTPSPTTHTRLGGPRSTYGQIASSSMHATSAYKPPQISSLSQQVQPIGLRAGGCKQ